MKNIIIFVPTKTENMQKSVEGVVNILHRVNEYDDINNIQIREVELNIEMPGHTGLLVSKNQISQTTINSALNYTIDHGTKVLVMVDNKGEIKLGKDGMACISKYIPKTYTEDEVVNIIMELMHQIHNADENVVFSDKKIDLKISPINWFKKYCGKFGTRLK